MDSQLFVPTSGSSQRLCMIVYCVDYWILSACQDPGLWELSLALSCHSCCCELPFLWFIPEVEVEVRLNTSKDHQRGQTDCFYPFGEVSCCGCGSVSDLSWPKPDASLNVGEQVRPLWTFLIFEAECFSYPVSNHWYLWDKVESGSHPSLEASCVGQRTDI